METLAKQITVEDPLKSKHAFEWDSQTVETFLNKETAFASKNNIIYKDFSSQSMAIYVIFLLDFRKLLTEAAKEHYLLQ